MLGQERDDPHGLLRLSDMWEQFRALVSLGRDVADCAAGLKHPAWEIGWNESGPALFLSIDHDCHETNHYFLRLAFSSSCERVTGELHRVHQQRDTLLDTQTVPYCTCHRTQDIRLVVAELLTAVECCRRRTQLNRKMRRRARLRWQHPSVAPPPRPPQ